MGLKLTAVPSPKALILREQAADVLDAFSVDTEVGVASLDADAWITPAVESSRNSTSST